MPWFRPAPRDTLPPRLDEDTVRALLADVTAACHFYPGAGRRVSSARVVEAGRPWEVFQGRLLDPAHTRERRDFESFDVRLDGPAPEEATGPVVSVKFDPARGEVFIVRYFEAYVLEAFDEGGNVIGTREVRRRVAELVGTLDLAGFASLSELRDELICRLFHAVAGSRLPLSSVEAPLPAFAFGGLFYLYQADAVSARPTEGWRDLIPRGAGASGCEAAKLLETLIRAAPPDDLPELADRLFAGGRSSPPLPALTRALFNGVSLSPWTDFVAKALAFFRLAEGRGGWAAVERIDFLGWLLRQVGRHLTAYDLVTFHHRGANYPDALLLDAVLADYLDGLARHPDLFAEEGKQGARLRRRALRQAWLLRLRYEGHPVPDLPTSPGENARVLPESHPRVPEEQILDPKRRRRQLFPARPAALAGDAPARRVLARAARDLLHSPEERRELGAALFLDRPFGGGKGPAEPDTTLLLSSLGYSADLAAGRVGLLQRDGLLTESEARTVRESPGPAGVPLTEVGGPARVGTVSLDDARRVARDFVFLHTTRASLTALWEAFDFPGALMSCPALAEGLRPLAERAALVARSPAGPGVRVLDLAGRPRLELVPILEGGYVSRAGVEVPAAGLRVTHVAGGEGAVARPRR